jgi:hypothetical protein
MSTITISEFGTVGSNSFFDGIDEGGFFGPPGASLVGKSFMAIFTGSDCNCSGGILPDGTPIGTGVNPVQDATLTINGQTFDFGSGATGDMFTSFAQVDSFDSSGRLSILNIQGGPLGMGAGGFTIQTTGSDGFLKIASGTFLGQQFSNSLFVPGPIAGDLPALFLLALLPWLIKRKLSSYRPQSSVR